MKGNGQTRTLTLPPGHTSLLSTKTKPLHIRSYFQTGPRRIVFVWTRNIPLPESVASLSVVSSELPVSPVRSVTVPPPFPGPSPIRSPETLPMTSLLSSVTKSTPSTLTPSPDPASPRAPHSLSIRESLWAPETDDTYEPSILAASPSVQCISFPETQDISFDTSILQSTASAYNSQEPSRLSTIDESFSSESPSIIPSCSLSPLTPTAIVSVSVSASSPPLLSTVRSPLSQVPSSTTVVTPSLFPRPTSVILTSTPSIVSTVSSISMSTDILEGSVSDLGRSFNGTIAVIHTNFESSEFSIIHMRRDLTILHRSHRHMPLYRGCYQHRLLAQVLT